MVTLYSMAPLLTFTFAFLALVHLTRAFEVPTIPLNWTTLSTCAVDNAARVLADDITTVTEENTPAACITSCAASGFGYAGVEFGDECHCATGLKAPLDEGAAAVCDMACAGDPNLSCGGVWSIQVSSSVVPARLVRALALTQLLRYAGVYGTRSSPRQLGVPGVYR